MDTKNLTTNKTGLDSAVTSFTPLLETASSSHQFGIIGAKSQHSTRNISPKPNEPSIKIPKIEAISQRKVERVFKRPVFLLHRNKTIDADNPAAFVSKFEAAFNKPQLGLMTDNNSDLLFSKALLNQESTYDLLFNSIKNQTISLEKFYEVQWALQINMQFSPDYQGRRPVLLVAEQLDFLDMTELATQEEVKQLYLKNPDKYADCIIQEAFEKLNGSGKTMYPFWRVRLNDQAFEVLKLANDTNVAGVIDDDEDYSSQENAFGWIHKKIPFNIDPSIFTALLFPLVAGPANGVVLDLDNKCFVIPSYAFSQMLADHFKTFEHFGSFNFFSLQSFENSSPCYCKQKSANVKDDEESMANRFFYGSVGWETLRELRVQGVNPVSVYHPDIRTSLSGPHGMKHAYAFLPLHDMHHYSRLLIMGKPQRLLFLTRDRLVYSLITKIKESLTLSDNWIKQDFIQRLEAVKKDLSADDKVTLEAALSQLWDTKIADCITCFTKDNHRKMVDLDTGRLLASEYKKNLEVVEAEAEDEDEDDIYLVLSNPLIGFLYKEFLPETEDKETKLLMGLIVFYSVFSSEDEHHAKAELLIVNQLLQRLVNMSAIQLFETQNKASK